MTRWKRLFFVTPGAMGGLSALVKRPYARWFSRKGGQAAHGARASAKRLAALTRKESLQIVRDPSSIGVGVVLPLVLILLFGYGMSLDVKNAPVAVVLEDPSPGAREAVSGLRLSPYFQATFVPSMREAEDLMLNREVDGVVRVPPDFVRRLKHGDARVQLLVHGADANRARIILGYAQAAMGQWAARQAAQGKAVVAGPVTVESRLWFNEANESRRFLVPGLIVLVMTLIGALLTTLVVAREWERGTLEALFVTPARVGEILTAKIIPYFALGMIGLALCLLSAKFLFDVPFRGSLAVLVGVSMLYLLVALGLGLFFSTATKSQFVAVQLTMLTSFLPALMLSGFIFDPRSMPLPVRIVGSLTPAKYYVSLLQTLFLAGNVWSVIVPNTAVLAGMAALFLILSRKATRKSLE